MARFFSAMAMGGNLYPQGLSQSGQWRSEALVYYPEDVAQLMTSPYPQDKLVVLSDDLCRIVRGSTLPAVKVWIHENLEAVARELWVMSRLDEDV